MLLVIKWGSSRSQLEAGGGDGAGVTFAVAKTPMSLAIEVDPS